MKDIIIRETEKYLKNSFKNIRIKNIQKIELIGSKEDDDFKLIEYIGDYNLLKESFKDIDEVLIEKDIIKVNKNINKDEFKEIINLINIKIEDFNVYSNNRKPIEFF